MIHDAMKSLRQALVAVGLDNVVIGDLPELKTNCVALRPVDGYPSTVFFGMRETLEPLVEIIVRNREYEHGATQSDKAFKALNNYSDDSVGLALAKIVGSPGYLGRNQNGFGEWHLIAHLSLNDY